MIGVLVEAPRGHFYQGAKESLLLHLESTYCLLSAVHRIARWCTKHVWCPLLTWPTAIVVSNVGVGRSRYPLSAADMSDDF
jgi:hypothetical protein